MNTDTLRNKIALNRIDLVFKELPAFLKGKDSNLMREFTKLSALWNALKEKNRNGFSPSESVLEGGKFNDKILDFLDLIDGNVKIKESLIVENEKIRILFLSANPIDTSKLQLDSEFVEIKKLIQNSPEKDKFELYLDTNITPSKLQDAIQTYKPNIFHFSGHGFGTGELNTEEGKRNVNQPPALSGLMIEDKYGKSKVLSQSALDGLFELVADEADVEVVILNACYSAEQATTIKKHIKNVIGMTDTIKDKSAITFATGFYQALANGKSVEMAFKYGRNLIALEGLNEEHKVILV